MGCKTNKVYYQSFFWVLIDLIVELLGLIIKPFDNQTERTLSEVFLLFKPESNPQNKGNTEFWIQMGNNPAQHVYPFNSDVVIRPTVHDTQPPPCVMTTGVWNGGRPKFRSLRRTRVTPDASTPKATTHNSVNTWRTKWQRCESHDTTHTLVPHQRHTRDLTHKGSSEAAINKGPH